MRIGMGLVLLGLTAAGCANQPVAAPFEPSMSRLGATFQSVSDFESSDGDQSLAPRRTLATRVLSAMAFERVTGFKADPARLLETD